MESNNLEKGSPAYAVNLDKASRFTRLLASFFDGAIMMVFILPVVYYTGGFDGIAQRVQPSLSYSLLIGLYGIVVFVLLNSRLLLEKGQTIGKRALGIKIVTLSGELPDVTEHLLKRYGVYFLIGQIPIIGQTLSLLNALIIFGNESRCGHDYAAGTAVVNS